MNPNRNVVGATQQCDARSITPCDPTALLVRTQYLTKDGVERRLGTVRRLRGGPVPRNNRKIDAETRQLLQSYDLVLDAIAGYPSSEQGNPSAKLRVNVATALHGRCCRAQHPRLVATPSAGPEPQYIRTQLQMGPIDYHAIPSRFDTFGGRGIFGFWAFLMLFMPRRDPKLIVIRTQGCGRRAPGAGAAVGELNAVVRLFRAGEWKLKLTLPAISPMSCTRGGTAKERAARAAARATPPPPEQSRGWKAEEYRERVRKDLEVKLERNGMELQGAQRITRLLDSIIEFRETLKAILAAMRRCPQFGWRFEGKFNVLVGSLELSWGPEALTTPELNGRYLPVRTKMGLKASLKFIDVELELSFGILAECETLKSRVETRVIGTLRAHVGIEVNVPLLGRDTAVQIPVVIRGEIEGSARANATVAGVNIIDGRFSVHTALRGERAMVNVGKEGIRGEGIVKMEAVEVEAEIQVGILPKYKAKIEVLEEREVMRFR
ncbi:Hypothetical protein A7982_00094 [Minicystis rosea]|nr:Hypothetical protein A7982_00094 [Minicystis rosea]